MLEKYFKVDKSKLLFDDKTLWYILIPVMLEQFLNSFMGTADSMMVSRAGSAALSAVSLVDSINVLFIQMFAALAAGATIVCSQYIGAKDIKNANEAARQVIFTVFAISIVITVGCLAFCRPLLSLVFGAVEEEVMDNSITYFWLTSVSFPFVALFNAGSAFYRAGGETRFPMVVSVLSNIMNIVLNAVFIFGLGMGIFGAALATLLSRIFCTIVIFIYLYKDKQPIVVRNYLSIKPKWVIISMILAVGIPSGIENSMFQFGKLAIQSSISTLGTTAIAANAMAILLENLNGIAGMAMGIALMTVVGQCMGAGEVQQAKYYIAKVTIWAYWVVLASCIFIIAITKPVISLAGMTPESGELCFKVMIAITLYKPFLWVLSFVPGYGMRAAGDVKFSMITATLTMWLCRVLISVCLIRYTNVGIMGMWLGMFSDWTLRAICFSARYASMRWTTKKVV